MAENLPIIVPSLSKAFEGERKALSARLSEGNLTAGQIVTEARRSLDWTGEIFSAGTSDIKLQKAGLWLLEMVKSGTSVLDQGTQAEIIWHEVPGTKKQSRLGSYMFFGAAGILGVAAVVQDSRPALVTAFTLAMIRLLEPENWRGLWRSLPFVKTPDLIEDQSGRAIKAEAQIMANSAGFVDVIADALKTADHILARLAEPDAETHWRDDRRLMTFVQGLLEAEQASDGDFALKLVGQELESILASEGIQKIDYTPKTAELFDVLPGIGQGKTQVAAPALKSGDQVIARGTVWGKDGS